MLFLSGAGTALPTYKLSSKMRARVRSGSFPLGRLGWGSGASFRFTTPIPTFPLSGGRRLIPQKGTVTGTLREEVTPTVSAKQPARYGKDPANAFVYA